MAKIRVVDTPTLAKDPPGGKVHYIDRANSGKLPTEIGRDEPTAKSRAKPRTGKTAASRKSPATRKASPKRKVAAKKRSVRKPASAKKVSRAKK